MDQRMLRQLASSEIATVTIVGVSVEIASDHEMGSAAQATRLALIVVNVVRALRIDVVRPEANLIEVSAAIAVFWSIKHWGSWM